MPYLDHHIPSLGPHQRGILFRLQYETTHGIITRILLCHIILLLLSSIPTNIPPSTQQQQVVECMFGVCRGKRIDVLAQDADVVEGGTARVRDY